MSILEVRDVSIIYSDDKRVAVEHASFKIEAGEYACIIGSNGSGKSTLSRGLWDWCLLHPVRSFMRCHRSSTLIYHRLRR